MLKLILGNKAYSSWSMRGWLALKASGLEFEELVVPLYDGGWDERREGDEFAPSSGKVPLLWHDDLVVWDSLAIIEYCADLTEVGRFWPEDLAARAMARSMAAEMHSSFASLRRECPMNVRRNVADARPVAARRSPTSIASSCCGRRPAPGMAAAARSCSANGARWT